MNKDKLKKLEHTFLVIYKDGFDSEEMKKIGKKHNISKLTNYIHEVCDKDNFRHGLSVYYDIMKIVSKSSMVSVFEKMRFRDLIKELDDNEKHELMDGIYENLHGNEEKGFNILVNFLSRYKLAKWPIISVFRAYYNVNYDVFMKPTTVKKIIKHLELNDIVYNSRPSFDFYNKYRGYINQLKPLVDKRLSPNNPAFSGFLMMTIE